MPELRDFVSSWLNGLGVCHARACPIRLRPGGKRRPYTPNFRSSGIPVCSSEVPRPPDIVALVARTHWIVGGTILLSVLAVRWLVSRFPVDFTARTWAITLSLAALYLTAGTLVWFGAPFGRILSRVCSLIYLARPQLGPRLWQIMDSEEFRRHFGRRKG